MDFLDPQKQRRNTAQLFIGYFLMFIMFSLILLILIKYVQGVGVTRNGEVIQKGLVFISSQPSGADIYIDNKLSETTNAKLNINEGDHRLDIRRTGYTSWQRDIVVQGGGVSHFVYPFLFPTNLTTDALKTYDTPPPLITQSPDRRWIVALQDVTAGTFEQFDLNGKPDEVKQSTEFSVPETLLTDSVSVPRWEIMEWSNNNRHMLFKRYFTPKKGAAEAFEYILIDRQRPEGSYNLSNTLGVTPTELTLRDKKPDSYYLFDTTAHTLSTASLDQPAPVLDLSDVLAFKSHGSDTVVYATTEKSQPGQVSIKFRQGAKDFLVRTVPESTAYVLDVARYDGDWYVVMGSQADNKVYIYKNPSDTATISKVRSGALFTLRVEAPSHVAFSANAQYILAQNATAVRIYDIEYDKAYHYDAPYPVDAPQTKITWMDGNRLTYVSGGKQVVFDYDNINRHELVPSSPTYPAMFDRDYKYMYSFTTPDSQAGLTFSVTPLRIAGDL